MNEYPRKNEKGETVWACCESSIGPTCQHRTVEGTPTEETLGCDMCHDRFPADSIWHENENVRICDDCVQNIVDGYSW
jgi:hypothetical protein